MQIIETLENHTRPQGPSTNSIYGKAMLGKEKKKMNEAGA